jgi:hypothetical protein
MSYPRRWCPKMLREYLCSQQTYAPDRFTRYEIQRLIDVLDLHRPTGSDGKHGNLHTPTCGCEDKPGQSTEDERATCDHGWTQPHNQPMKPKPGNGVVVEWLPCPGPIPDQPATCEHGKTEAHGFYHGQMSQWIGQCPGPVPDERPRRPVLNPLAKRERGTVALDGSAGPPDERPKDGER